MNKWYEDDPWILTQDKFDPAYNVYYETILSQSNGYMGMHAFHEEQSINLASRREGYIAGLFADLSEETQDFLGRKPWKYVGMAPLPTIFNCNLYLRGQLFDPLWGTVKSYKRSLDMRDGVLTRTLTWTSPGEFTTELVFERFLSLANPNLAAQKITIKPLDWEGEAKLVFVTNANVLTRFRPGPEYLPRIDLSLLAVQGTRVDRRSATINAVTEGTKHRLSVVSAIRSQPCRGMAERHAVTQIVSRNVCKNVSFEVERFIAVVTSRDALPSGQTCEKRAREIAVGACRRGFSAVGKESATAWKKRWDMVDIEIGGAPRDQKAVRYNLFNLIQLGSFHTDCMSLPARGLSYNRYLGLYFWDTEIFLLPFYTYVLPGVAHNLLVFRSKTLPGARETSRWHGYKGAAFPFMGDSDTGREQCDIGLSRILLHVSADVSYAVDQYGRVANDLDFMGKHGLEVLLETARYWTSRVTKDDKGQYHLDGAAGPCEFAAPGRDNAYTNLMLRRNIQAALTWHADLSALRPKAVAAVARKIALKPAELKQWKDVADHLCIPTVPGTDIPLQDESFLKKEQIDVEARGLRNDPDTWGFPWWTLGKYRVIKQADVVLAALLLEDSFSRDQLKRIYEYYDPMTLHISSLSRNTSATVAAKLNRMDEAYDQFLKTALLDLDNMKPKPNDGLHTANMGGCWQAIVMGFAGMRLINGSLTFDPHLPAAWKSLSFCVTAGGQAYTVKISRKGSCEVIKKG